MTEAEWLAADDLPRMLDRAEGEKLWRRQLFAVAACRRLGPLPAECEAVLSATEQYADDAMNKRQVLATHEAMWDVQPQVYEGLAALCSGTTCLWHGHSGHRIPCRVLELVADPAAEAVHLSALLRCVFGNPFRPVVFATVWRTATAVAVAEGVYADRAFDRLPVLADALEDAGCDSAELLAHLRGPGPHARGCWALDAVLGNT
jgi:hypothetical protein